MADKTVLAQGATENDYELLSDAYYGNGGFADKSHIIQHQREDAEKLTRRKALAYYLNYTKPLVKANVNPVFRKEATRNPGGNKMFEGFLEDVDTNKTKMAKFIHNAAKLAKLKEVNFIVVDNVKEQPENVADALKDRKFPYCYTVKPESIQEYIITNTGRLTYLSYLETSAEEPTVSNLRVWTENEWFLMDQVGKNFIDLGEHNLGRVPVVMLRASFDDPKEVLPYSEFMPLAEIEKQLFNRCSWWDEILSGQAFPVLTFPGNLNDLTLGANNALSYDPNQSHEPAYISPSADPCVMIMDEINFLVAEVYRMAGLANVTGVKQALSGLAKQWDNVALADSLSEFAGQCERAEQEIAEIFALWTNSPVNYEVQYSRDFNTIDVTTELKNALDVQTLNLGAMMARVVARRAAGAYSPGLPEKDLKTIENEAVKGAEDAANADAATYTADALNTDQNTK